MSASGNAGAGAGTAVCTASVGRPVIQAGRPFPLGAHADASGLNIAVFSSHAQGIDICLFDADGQHEIARHQLPQRTGEIWHGYLPGIGVGCVYGLRARGPWQPERGHRFNAHKLLLDPYAREVVGQFVWADQHLSHQRDEPGVMDPRDNASTALKARVASDSYDWGTDRPLATPLARTVLYELHVKGFSQLNASVPAQLRGSYAGLAHEASLAHLKKLGVTAVSLLPVHLHISEERLGALGLSNYWGYNTIGFFALDPRLASGSASGDRLQHDAPSPRDEFRAMVKALHAARIEVLLDVVYNHTAEGNEHGPCISFKGLDNAAYYRQPHGSAFHYENFTGCGNTFDLRHPEVLRLVLDSLRYWVADMHVDGFRFDLAPVLGRTTEGFNRQHAFFTAIAQDPVLSRVKLIAEPWDVGPGGYQVGAFPRGWLEWNDHFRDTLRGFWVSRTQGPGALAQRLCASADVFNHRARSALESVNYVVSHDGFTLLDLVSYNERHNQANGEGNRDGHGHNLSFNCGFEGPTHNVYVNAQRAQLQRALLACTLLAQGTPMLAAGDELGHSQQGNNNAYCQDNATSWIDWSAADNGLIDFTAHVISLRKHHWPLGPRWYTGAHPDGATRVDLTWLQADGSPLVGDAWHKAQARVLGCLIGAPGCAALGPNSQHDVDRATDSTAPQLLLINASDEAQSFKLPAGQWRQLLDSASTCGRSQWVGTDALPLAAGSVALLVQVLPKS